MRLAPGLRLTAELHLVRMLRRGAMGEVWIGDSKEWGQVAVKFLTGGMEIDRAALQRFEREWMMASGIDSPHVVRMLDMGTFDAGRPYIVMELLDGETLQDVLDREGKLSPQRTVKLLSQVAEALDAAHRCGIVHRDIKPDNILLVEDRDDVMVKVLDFGLAKPWLGGHTLTQTGLVMGTPYFMSPEQVSGGGQNIDHRADLWAFAALTYRMLSGAFPFEAPALHALVYEILKGEYTPIEERGGPAELAPWFAKAFKGPRDERFDSAGEMIAELAVHLGLASPAHHADETTTEVTLMDSGTLTQMVTDLDTTQVFHDSEHPRSLEVDTQPVNVPSSPRSSGTRGPDSITQIRDLALAQTALPDSERQRAHESAPASEPEPATKRHIDPIAQTIVADEPYHLAPRSTPSPRALMQPVTTVPASSEPATRPRRDLDGRLDGRVVAQRPLPPAFSIDDGFPTVDASRPAEPSQSHAPPPHHHPPSAPPPGTRKSYPSVPPDVVAALSALGDVRAGSSGVRHASSHPPPGFSSLPPPAAPTRKRSSAGLWLGLAALTVACTVGAIAWRASQPNPGRNKPTDARPSAAPRQSAWSAEHTEPTTTAIPSAVATTPEPATSAAPIASSERDDKQKAAAAAGMGLLTVRCEPRCLVWLGAKKLGVSPIKDKPVGIGTHRLKAYRDDTGAKYFDIEVKRGERLVLDVALR